ncbi:Lar family restriction alleviation protein [Burkholderia gladioli]|uniref:Lar family restriction alleviation protein n=1 Tax=Burkholderia gladioli TaxID=28095 RepID=UPI00164232FC|nr:Lar family restriction alleviation protein [Burkholderia gladioli]
MSDKLSDCPFCGDNNCTVSTQIVGKWKFVYCPYCLAEGPARDTEADAIAAWNRRASPAPAISESEDALLTAARRAIPALAHAAERNPVYQRDYEELSRAIDDGTRKGEKS